MLRHPAGRDQDGVEAHVVSRMFGVRRKPGFRRGDDPAALTHQHRFRRLIEGFARLDLDERRSIDRA